MKIDKFIDSENWYKWVGLNVEKYSGKKFKSGNKVESIVEYVINPFTNKNGFKLSDGSIVDCYQCKISE